MNYRKLGKTDLLVSEIGLGTWGISGNGYGPTDDEVSKKTIHTALDKGVNFLDTADSYGNGKSETIIGEVLRERNDIETVVATKVGWDFYNNTGIRGNLGPNYIKFALNQSLKRLGRDWIDLYQIHLSNPKKIKDWEAYETLKDLKREGKIRYYGVSVDYIEDGIESIENSVDSIQITYNIINQEAERELIPLARKKGVGIIAKEPLASGLLSGKYDINCSFHKKDHRNGWSRHFLETNLDKVKRLAFLKNSSRKLAQSAISFVLSSTDIAITIPGAKTPEQVEENLSSSSKSLSTKELNKVKQLYEKSFSQ